MLCRTRWSTTLRSLAILILVVCGLGQIGIRPAQATMIWSGALDVVERRAPSSTDPDYVPPPAKSYALQPSEAGDGFSVRNNPTETLDGRGYSIQLQAPGAKRLHGGDVLSDTDISFVACTVTLGPPGSNDSIVDQFGKLLSSWKSNPRMTVVKLDGWTSEQAWTFSWGDGDAVVRGIMLQHHNATVIVEARGKNQFTTLERVTRLAQIVEGRIHAALQ
jgi:hypothetical protein